MVVVVVGVVVVVVIGVVVGAVEVFPEGRLVKIGHPETHIAGRKIL